MDLTRFNLMQAQAEAVLAAFQQKFDYISKPPIPVIMIAQAFFGLQCDFHKLDCLGSGTLGAISVNDEAIYVDARHSSWHRHIFTVAHEIGHWVLHEDKFLFQLDNIPQTIPWGRIRSTQVKRKNEQAKLREIEANLFGQALLMPRNFLSAKARSYEIIDAKAVRELAKDFDVSLGAMLCRVRDLSRHLAWVGPCIDWNSLDQLESLLACHRSTKKQMIEGPEQENQKTRSDGRMEQVGENDKTSGMR